MKHVVVKAMFAEALAELGIDINKFSADKVQEVVVAMANQINSQNNGKPGKSSGRGRVRGPSLADLE